MNVKNRSMSLDAHPTTSSTSRDSIYKYKRDRRRKSRLKRWSRLPRTPASQREFTILPTRKTLTYAEAQKFVDVLSDGQVHRLNVSDSIQIETSHEIINAIEKEQDDSEHIDLDVPTKTKFNLVCQSINANNADAKRLAPFKLTQAYLRCFEKTVEEFDEEVEYDVDEEDIAWLKFLNDHRKATKLLPVSLDDLEYVLDRLEKEAHVLTTSDSFCPDNEHRQHQRQQEGKISTEDRSCCVCREVSMSATNSILVCDSCNLSVHQDCYGVPYHPNGEWLCRKCLKSPNSPVKCSLCPGPSKDKEGPCAMKQTGDGKWVHVVCALFIPEISFGSNVYLEPVERVDKVPRWRYELKCQGCHKAGQGACLGCQAPSCSHSFHALCAIRKGCYVKLVGSSASSSEVDSTKLYTSKRTGDRRTRILFCPKHVHLSGREGGLGVEGTVVPKEEEHPPKIKSESDVSRLGSPEMNESQTSINKCSLKKPKAAKRSRKSNQLNNSLNRDFNPMSAITSPIAVPNLSQESLVNIASHLSVRDKQQVMMRMHRYWLLKRHSRSGFPLIQRLQQVLLIHHMLKMQSSLGGLPSRVGKDDMKTLKKLRQDYEKVRLLLELIRKRERLKVEMLRMKEACIELTLQPFSRLLRQTLEQVQSKDSIGLFAYPVTEEEAPGYLGIIKNPMDYWTMSSKIDDHLYTCMDDFERDFHLIIDNCLQFNGVESPLYKIAIKHKKQCSVILESAQRLCTRANFCPITGLHTNAVLLPAEDKSDKSRGLECSHIVVHNDEVATGKMDRNESLELKGKLEELYKRLDVLNVVRTKGVFQKVKLLRKEISLTKRRMTFLQQQQKINNTSINNMSAPTTSAPPNDNNDPQKSTNRSIPSRSSKKRNVCRTLEDEFTSDSTILERSSNCDEGQVLPKRPRLSSDATELFYASSLSSTTVIMDVDSALKHPRQNELQPSKFRSASKRNRLNSNTNLPLTKSKSHHNHRMHSTPQSVNKIGITNNLMLETLSFVSPVREESSINVADENKEPMPNKLMISRHMRLRSSIPAKVEGLRNSRPLRTKTFARKTSTETQSTIGQEPSLESQSSVTSQIVEPIVGCDVQVQVEDLPLIPKRMVRVSRRILQRTKVKSPSKKENGAANIMVGSSKISGEPIRRSTRSSSMLSQGLPQSIEQDSASTKSSSSNNKLIKSNFIEKTYNLSPEAEKMLNTSPVVLVEKSPIKGNPSSEEIDSSYESSYSLDSADNSSTKKESTELQKFSFQIESSISVKSNPPSDTQPGLNHGQILLDLESKGMNSMINNLKTSRSSSSTCSKDAEDLCTPLAPGDVVWAKTKGYPWYPAMIITPNCLPTEEPQNYFQNLIPPDVVMSLKSKFTMPVHLVRFFDKRKNWQWLPRSKLDTMESDGKLDKERVNSMKQCNLRKDMKRAFDAAILHRRTALRKILNSARACKHVEKTSRERNIRGRQARAFHKQIEDDCSIKTRGDSSDANINSVLEEVSDRIDVLEQSSKLAPEPSANSQQPLLNCSQQFFNGFQSEKLESELNSNLQLVISQQPKLLSCSL